MMAIAGIKLSLYTSNMKNSNRGYVLPLVILFAIIVIGGGLLFYMKNKQSIAGVPVEKPLVSNITATIDSTSTLAVVTTKSNTIERDCGTDINCLIIAAKTCTPAKVDIKTTVDFSKGILKPSIVSTTDNPTKLQQTQRTLQEILGAKNGKCVYSQKTLEIINPNLPDAGKSAILNNVMTCSYDNNDLATRLQNVQNGVGSISMSTNDTPEQAAQRQCQNYGAHLK